MRIRTNDGTETGSGLLEVPARSRPLVVCTNPPPRKRDVPLKSTMTVVFSEPVDPATVTPTSLSLFGFGTPVRGSVSLDQGSAQKAVVAPASDLDPLTTYELRVSDAVPDPTGDAVAPINVQFTTVPGSDDGITRQLRIRRP